MRKDERNNEKQNGECQRRSSQKSNIQRTGDISHDGCPTQEEKLEKGLGLLEKKHNTSPNPLNVSMFNTCERQTDRYCVDELKELCNECEFTSDTKADLEKHTSEVHHKDCVPSTHRERIDKSKNSVEEVKTIFYCPFKCGFLNEEEGAFLIHMAENHDFLRSNYEACHLCTFCCTTKNGLAEHTSEVHQNGQKLTIPVIII